MITALKTGLMHERECAGQRSSRLSLQYGVLYTVERNIVIMFVLEISPHVYSGGDEVT
jgi:hypothetical protein